MSHKIKLFQFIMLYLQAIWHTAARYGVKMINILSSKKSRLQKRAIRIITFSNYDAHTEPLFKQLKILKIKDIITLYNCIFIHDFSKNLLPSSFNDFFTLCTDLHETDTRRTEGCVFVPQVATTRYGRQSIRVSSILRWNHLTEVMDQNLFSLTKPVLKKSLTKFFLNSYSS